MDGVQHPREGPLARIGTMTGHQSGYSVGESIRGIGSFTPGLLPALYAQASYYNLGSTEEGGSQWYPGTGAG